MYIPELKEADIPMNSWEITNGHLFMTLRIESGNGNIRGFIKQWKRLGCPGLGPNPAVYLEANDFGYHARVRRKMPEGMNIPTEDFIRETYRLGYNLVKKLCDDADYMLKILEAALLSNFPQYNYFFKILKDELVPKPESKKEKAKAAK